jgi:hypothetical protein
MSEQRNRAPREVTNVDSVATRLSEFATTYVKVVAGFPVPVAPKYNEGHRCSALDARALNWAHVSRAASVANSNVTRGAQSKLSDAEKVAWLTKYLNEEYKFTEDLGSEFGSNVVETAVDRIVFNLGVAQGKLSGSYDDHSGSAEREKRQPLVTKIMTDPSLADKYEPMARSEIAAIFAERHEIATRSTTAKGALDVAL